MSEQAYLFQLQTTAMIKSKLRSQAQILAILRAHKTELSMLGVRRLGLFGSWAKGAARADSDIDLLVELDQPSYSKMYEVATLLERLLEHPVDLVRKGPHLNRELLKSIEKDIIYV